jgi:Flp pilus assembly protein TadG
MARDLFRRLTRDDLGNVIIVFALGAPVLVGASVVAVDYSFLAKRQSELQRAVDNAAIAGTKELALAGTTDSRVESVARSVVLTAAGTAEPRTRVDVAVIAQRTQVQVVAEEQGSSQFGRVLPAMMPVLRASATAQIMGATTKLCMLALDTASPDVVHLHKNAMLTAKGCMVQANSSDRGAVHFEKRATVAAERVCSVGGSKVDSTVTMNRPPQSDCAPIKDPLASRPAPPIGSCLFNNMKVDGKLTPVVTLLPGTYCGGLQITNGAKATLMSGIYVIDNGPLVVDADGQITGKEVGFYFTGNKGGVLFDVKSTIDIGAPKDGPMSGLLFFENRSVSAPVPPPLGIKLLAPPPPPPGSPPMREYRIVSDNARNLLGTIYLPAGRIVIDANKPVADLSQYTVIVARQVEVFDGPNLYLNTNYSGTDVPVPPGVGNNAQGVRLAK